MPHEISLVDKFRSTKAGRRRFAQARAIVKVTDQLEQAMEQREITRAQLAGILGKTKGWVTQLLDGEQNKTIRTVADTFAALGMEFVTGYRPFKEEPLPISGDLLRFMVNMPKGIWTNATYLNTTNVPGGWLKHMAIKGIPRRIDTSLLESVSNG